MNPVSASARDTFAEAVEAWMFRAFFRSTRWRSRAYGGAVVIVVFLIAQLGVALRINHLNKTFYDIWSDPGRHDLQEAYAALMPFVLHRMPLGAGEHPGLICHLKVRVLVARSRDIPLSGTRQDRNSADRRVQPTHPGRCRAVYQSHGNHRFDRGEFHFYAHRVRTDFVGTQQWSASAIPVGHSRFARLGVLPHGYWRLSGVLGGQLQTAAARV